MYYLFSRFVLNAKSILQAQITGELVSNILTRMQVRPGPFPSLPLLR